MRQIIELTIIQIILIVAFAAFSVASASNKDLILAKDCKRLANVYFKDQHQTNVKSEYSYWKIGQLTKKHGLDADDNQLIKITTSNRFGEGSEWHFECSYWGGNYDIVEFIVHSGKPWDKEVFANLTSRFTKHGGAWYYGRKSFLGGRSFYYNFANFEETQLDY